MRTYNRATVIGRVGNDVVLRYTQSGKPVVNLSLATDERRKDGPEVTTWHRVVLWDRLAELADRYVRKGQPVYVEGPLSSRQWTDQEGTVHWRTELTARELIFLGSREQGSAELAQSPTLSVDLSGQARDGEELEEVTASIPL